MDNAARARKRGLAIFLPVTAVLHISADALSLRRPGYAKAFSATTRISHDLAEARLVELPGMGATAWGYCS